MAITGAIKCKANVVSGKKEDTQMMARLEKKISKFKSNSIILAKDPTFPSRLAASILAFLMILG